MTRSSGRRVLWIVDDSPLDAQRASRVLAPDYGVRIFNDGSTMLEELSAGALPDLLLLDWVMSGVSGIDICHYLRSARPPLSTIPVLLLTVQHEVDQIVEGLEAGANDYLGKPYADAELKARVAALIRTRELLERAEAAEADVRRLLRSSPDVLIAVDARGQLTFANEEAARLLGREPDALVGLQVSEVFPELAYGNISVAPGESLLPLPDVSVGERVFSPSVRLLPSDSASATTISLRDVTDRRQAEARRLDFYSMIAHDLRTPLSAMLLRTELIMRGRHGILRPELASDIRKLEGNIRSLVAMINDFLELARLEGAGYKISGEQVDVAALLSQTCEDFLPLIDAGGLRWHHEGPAADVAVVGDRRRLVQVFANLVGNAIKFTPPGGTITTRLKVTDGMAEVQIADTGAGMDPSVLPHIFERYTRVVDRNHQVGGTGLGLMIVREIVDAHGGRVGVESRPGGGSTFWVRLPQIAAGTQPHV
jgi:signal transduction histidine kinase